MASVPAPDLDIRLEDYLDDKLQAAADLASLPQLLATVDLQRDQLQSQLDDADAALNQARLTAQQRRRSLQEAMDEFRNLQESIDARVEAAAASDAPNQAIARLELPMKKLRMVDLAHRYLSLLRQVYQWRTEALSHLPASPKAALEPYSRLRECALSLKSAQGDELLHLVDHVEQLADSLWSDMKATMSAELQLILSQRDWPRLDPGSEMDQPWIDCLEKLVDLQLPEILHATSVLPLLPMDVMASIFIAEFRFHFLSDKPTSSLQAVSSHCFPWFLALIEKWEPFFRDNLAHLLAAKFGHTPVAAKAVYLDPSCAFITSMLPVMREKVGAVAAQAADNPSLLSAFVSQLMTFDDNIRSRFDYDGGDPEQGWAGLTDDLLRDHFESWFQAERRFALDGFDAIMESQEARKIDYDFSFRGKMKPTFAAVRVTDLLRAVTSKYERLRKLTRKTRFLTDIQLDILDAYHDRLRGSLEAYQSMTSTLGRTLHGVSRDQLAALQGIGALETLCKVIGSADHVANTLAEWSDEEFFVDLWDQLQRRQMGQSDTEASGQGGVDPPDVASRIAAGTANGGIFDETVSAFAMRRRAAENLLASALADSHAKAFRAYLGRVQWTTVGETAELDDLSELSITPELDEPLRVIEGNLDFSLKALSTASARRVWYEALDGLQNLVWNGVLMRQHFTTLGAAQLAHDTTALLTLIDRHLPGASDALDCLRDALQLLNLPPALPAVGDGDGRPEASTAAITLKEASDRAFADNEGARRVLEELRLGSLTPANARLILQRRVENKENIGW